MGLNVSKGNMYDWVTHTWNTIKGKCPHDCTYCYVKRWGKQNSLRLDELELRTDLGSGNVIFLGSSCDMFANGIPSDWIITTLEHCAKYPNNRYLFQSKNPSAFNGYGVWLAKLDIILCTTIETNRVYPDIMCNSPDPVIRAWDFAHIPIDEKYITIEPIMDFDLWSLASMIRFSYPIQVNIGADSGGNNLPEPSKEKILSLIDELNEFTTVKQKSNLKRLLK